jgi:hypothetical protein
VTQTFKALIVLLADHRKWKPSGKFSGPCWEHENGTVIYQNGLDCIARFYVTGLVQDVYSWPWSEYRQLRRAIDRMQASKLTERQLDDYAKEVKS